MKLSAVIICYYPDLDDLHKNIVSCICFVDKLILWQNTPSEEISRYSLNTNIEEYGGKVISMSTGRNIGIAEAMNMAVKWSLENGYTHILTLDQDSSFKDGSLSLYKSIVANYQETDIGIFGANPICEGKPDYALTQPSIVVVDTITSGSIIPLKMFEKFGYFRSDLFIDGVDYEYCYRLKRGGFKTVIITQALMFHKVGYLKKIMLGLSTVNYSAFRTYFIIRNHIIIWRNYPELFSRAHKITLVKHHILSRLFKIVLGEQNKAAKIAAIIRGIKHGIKGKTNTSQFAI